MNCPLPVPSSDQLRRNIGLGEAWISIDLGHLQSFDEGLATVLMKRPSELITIVAHND